MSYTPTGGPAFPTENARQTGQKSSWHYEGMTMRDYFAAKAMGGMCMGAPIPQKNELDLIARRSYEMADAMLKARGS